MEQLFKDAMNFGLFDSFRESPIESRAHPTWKGALEKSVLRALKFWHVSCWFCHDRWALAKCVSEPVSVTQC
jgi:hypothetical protein